MSDASEKQVLQALCSMSTDSSAMEDLAKEVPTSKEARYAAAVAVQGAVLDELDQRSLARIMMKRVDASEQGEHYTIHAEADLQHVECVNDLERVYHGLLQACLVREEQIFYGHVAAEATLRFLKTAALPLSYARMWFGFGHPAEPFGFSTSYRHLRY